MVMPLKERIEELMRTTELKEKAQVARAAGVSTSAVSQWLGKGSKTIKSMDSTPAVALQAKTGYSWQWLAKGTGPKLLRSAILQSTEEGDTLTAGAVAPAHRLPLNEMVGPLTRAGPGIRQAVAGMLSDYAIDPARNSHVLALVDQLLAPFIDDPVRTSELRRPEQAGTSGDQDADHVKKLAGDGDPARQNPFARPEWVEGEVQTEELKPGNDQRRSIRAKERKPATGGA
jgi:hypothetical protein